MGRIRISSEPWRINVPRACVLPRISGAARGQAMRSLGLQGWCWLYEPFGHSQLCELQAGEHVLEGGCNAEWEARNNEGLAGQAPCEEPETLMPCVMDVQAPLKHVLSPRLVVRQV
jgi:hypothetical protein